MSILYSETFGASTGKGVALSITFLVKTLVIRQNSRGQSRHSLVYLVFNEPFVSVSVALEFFCLILLTILVSESVWNYIVCKLILRYRLSSPALDSHTLTHSS